MYKKIFNNKKAVIFDLNGTVTKETEGFKFLAINYVLGQHDFSYIDPIPYCVPGRPFDSILKSIFSAYKLESNIILDDLVKETEDAFIKIIENNPLETTPGFWDLIYELKEEKNYKVALVTNLSKKSQSAVVTKMGLDGVFDIIKFGDDAKKKKPNPEIYKKTLRELGVTNKQAVVFEDSVIGVEAAGKAGIDTIVIWDKITRKRFFKGKIVDFSEDFTPYPGKMDEEPLEYIVKKYQENQRG